MTPLFEKEGAFTMKSVRGRWQLDVSNGAREGGQRPHIRSGEGYADEDKPPMFAQTTNPTSHCQLATPVTNLVVGAAEEGVMCPIVYYGQSRVAVLQQDKVDMIGTTRHDASHWALNPNSNPLQYRVGCPEEA
jgi:hypothetical protein